MLDPRITLLFKNLPDKYPNSLAKDYPHVLNRLMQLWDTPGFDPYLHDLTVDKRGGRQGFPLGVVAELLFMGELHDAFKRKGCRLPKFEDPWKAIPVANPTPLGFLHAIERGQQNVIEVFLNAGVAIDYRFEGGQTPLMAASINGKLDVARYFIKSGAEINARDFGKYIALHWAAFYNRTQLIDELCNSGAEINAVQNSVDTPLSLAVTRGHIATARLLLERKANPNISSNHGSPIAIAQSRGNQEMITLLKQFGARG